jgi:glutamate formiminotransferase/formiminotetrahydrofolate cyclodeaminase
VKDKSSQRINQGKEISRIGHKPTRIRKGIIALIQLMRFAMVLPVLECIPNYSEARRPEVVEAIINSITSVSGVTLLDRHSDLDHNRTVLTIIGTPDAVEEAAFRSIAKAASLIDLDHHTGEHPRIGATDVVPFVPISGLSMQDCVQIARRLGQRVGSELNIPVYLYEEAATRPERTNLEYIRRGQYEALKLEMGVNPERDPDYGPHSVGPAGVTVIGARQPLIAYNVYLSTDDISVAEKIAKTIRFSSGGLRYVKALGMLVDGRAQISMNLTNFYKTPLALVVETIRREAARYGVLVHHAELVGLIPQQALVEAAAWYLQLDQFKPDQILEQAIFSRPNLGEKTTLGGFSSSHEFLDELAAGTATPGGGSACAFSAAAAAGLVSMVARLTIGKKKFAENEGLMQAILTESESLRNELTQSIQLDSSSFDAVMAAYKLPKDTLEKQEARRNSIQQATLQATEVPFGVAKKALRVLELAEQVILSGNPSALSDAATAAALARAAISGAGYNIHINARELPANLASRFLTDFAGIEQAVAEIESRLLKTFSERGL